MKKKLARLATTAVALEDFLVMPDAFSEGVTKAKAVKGSRERVKRVSDYFVEAWKDGADFVTGYESITRAGVFAHNPSTRDILDALVEPVPGPTTEFFGRLAKKHRGYCAICLDERDGDRVYNAAVLIDRDGEVAGKYRKVHLPPQERVRTWPGTEFPVFETDFGRIGFSICYDIMFPETARCVAMNGADLLVHIGNTTYTLQEQHVRVRAAENMMWVLACNIEGAVSMVVDPMGETVVRATPYTSRTVSIDVDLRRERPLPQDNLLSGVKSLRGRMCQERVPSAYRVLCAKEPPLQVLHEDDRIPRSKKEFKEKLAQAEPTFRKRSAEWDRVAAECRKKKGKGK